MVPGADCKSVALEVRVLPPPHIANSPDGYSTDMDAFILIMLIIGAVCFGLAALGVATRVNLVALGLFAWILTALIPALDRAL